MKDNILILKQLQSNTKALKTLYVEDSKEVREQTFRLLKNFFDDIDVAVNGQEGLEKYEEYFNQHNSYYDLIITDINMPYMNGLDLSKNILDINSKQLIVVVSAYNDSKNLQECINLGVTNYLHKPISLSNVVDALNKVVKSIQKNKNSLEHISRVEELNQEFDAVINNFDQYVIASRTDLEGYITYASRAYQILTGYTEKELLKNPHSIMRHPNMPTSLYKNIWNTIKNKKLWKGEIQNLNKNGTSFWIKSKIAPYYNSNGKHVGYSSIKIDITDQKKTQQLSDRVNDLLNNAAEGFLSFDKNLKCESGYSKVCLEIFNMEHITNHNISNLLFKHHTDKKELFKKAINNILKSKDTHNKKLFLSLLPKKIDIYKKIIGIEYKLLKNDRFMIILSDITDKIILEKKLNSQNQINKMITNVVSNKDDFFDIKTEFENFISFIPTDNLDLLHSLHTFKGIFAQKEMLYIVNSIHELESSINSGKEATINSFNILKESFNKDLQIIESYLQEDLSKNKNTHKVSDELLKYIEKKVQSLSKNIDKIDNNISEVLYDINKIRYKPVKNMLNIYPEHVKAMAQKFDKRIYPLEITGKNEIVASSKIRSFIKSLVHVFNNCVDHGIEEDSDIRVKQNKDEVGTIKCDFEQIHNTLIVEISDDGRGIDVDKLVNSAIEKGLKTKDECQLLSENEKLNLIFIDKLSTKQQVSTTSGRGVGMSAVKKSIEELGGRFFIQNSPKNGIRFEFFVPIQDYIPYSKNRTDQEMIIDALMKQSKVLLEETCGIEILSEQEVQNIDDQTLNNHSAKINLSLGCDDTIVICFTKELEQSIADVFIPKGFDEEANKEMIKELPFEINNTITGPSLEYFPKKLGDVNISPPLRLTQQDQELIKNVPEERLLYKITTNVGSLFCILISDNITNKKEKDDIEEIALI